ncbi:isochorismatase family cysteine hydrolase [Gluconacetobacter tumulisoli]|uniref:Cysteine hydrolase n=1 Tax=Gluconacetobacter tumulisoli TaxID=1286189 RepID=A0A7W4K9E6_9PROT|nr:isochorismatase family cysteine hydrolase [Gluconacetobacter tumulisoli]MBB2202786.1 cysteine hydrolase [Gluconacetobacter tumulisoli]
MKHRQETTRERPIYPGETALLFVDTQVYNCSRDGGEYAGLPDATFQDRFGYFFDQLESVALPNWVALGTRARATGIEVIYTVIESLTRDGRDRSLDYKITGFNVPRGSADARVIDPIAPADDDIVIPKTSSSVFISTNIDYVLRNLGIRSLIIVGCLTDQCVDSAVRDACDLGYLVTCVTDACLTLSQERQESSLRNNRGYARQIDTQTMLAEMSHVHQAATS